MRYLFRHVLMRDAVYEIQLRARLRDLHRLAAEAIETLHADDLAPHYADLAYHFIIGGETAQAVRYIRLASEQDLAVSSYRPAQILLEQGLALLDAHLLPNQERIRMVLLNLLGDANRGLCNYALATANYAQSLALARQIGDAASIADALLGLATSARGCGDYATARQHLEEALGWSARDSRLQTRVLDALGDVAREAGDYAAAEEYAQRSMAICQALDAPSLLAGSLARLGNIAYVQGDVATAKTYYEQSLAFSKQVGQLIDIASSLNNLGVIAHRHGRYAEAIGYYQQSQALELETGNRRSLAISWINMALAAKQLGDYGTVEEYAHRSLDAFREIGSRWGVAVVLGDLVPVYLQKEQPQRARKALCEGLHIAQEIQAVPRILSLLVGAAQWAMQAGYFDQAALWAGLVFAHPSTEQDYRDEAERLREELATALPPEELAAVWGQGQTLCLDRVVAEVVECATCSSTS